ncbi:hypothetical protein TTRE_0000879101 [Trichuris trichiura]|uniref:Uncharacterized protein n=1 Tax=Trichuris trichiura TaxID=36087 RepID=A0A077ZJ34_TRITR|nr:hypothetical protein TTRE_0000879101 [Trichuris trichiura]
MALTLRKGRTLTEEQEEEGEGEKVVDQEAKRPFDPKHLKDIALMTPKILSPDASIDISNPSSPASSYGCVSTSRAQVICGRPSRSTETEQALFLLAEDQPVVARSTPRGVVYDQAAENRWHAQHDMRYCLYDRWVYETIFGECVRILEDLENNLDAYIDQVRQSNIDRSLILAQKEERRRKHTDNSVRGPS